MAIMVYNEAFSYIRTKIAISIVLSWKSELSGKFHRFNATDGSNEMLKNN